MPITIEFSTPEDEAAFKAQAHAAGVSAEDLARRALEREIFATPEENSIAGLQRADPEEWGRQFRAWAQSHPHNTPLLSPEATSRESIYPDRS